MKYNYLLLAISGLIITACGSGTVNSAGVTYTDLPLYPNPESNTSTLVTGIRGVNNSTNVYISGSYESDNGMGYGVIYNGPLKDQNNLAKYSILMMPESGSPVTNTVFYGPNNGVIAGDVQVVGSYNTVESGNLALGLMYEGPMDGSGVWTRLNPQSLETESSVKDTIAHSTMGGIVVGNYDTDYLTGKAFIYDTSSDIYYPLVKPGAISITAYGIWANGGTSYTIVGGFSNVNAQGLTTGYMVDWDSATQTASNWTEINYKNQPATSVISHIEGITSDGNGGYNLAVDYGAIQQNGFSVGAAFAHVLRTSSGFGTAAWTDIVYPGSAAISANTVYQNNILGVYVLPGSPHPYSYLATVK